MLISDNLCRQIVALYENAARRVVGYSTRADLATNQWGAPHVVKVDEREVWRGDSHAEMMDRCAMERMRLALTAALPQG
jgi:hypothetical protein